MLVNDIEIFPKKKETESVSMVVNDVKIFQKMKNKRLVVYRKKFFKMLK